VNVREAAITGDVLAAGTGMGGTQAAAGLALPACPQEQPDLPSGGHVKRPGGGRRDYWV
jgi:hypothetical protein